MFDLIGIIEQYCTDNDYHFLCGDDFHQNYTASQLEYDNGQIVVGAFFPTINPTYSRGILTRQSQTGVLMVGRKFDDDTTPASLDETFIQKYNRRLKDLFDYLDLLIKTVICENELEVSNITVSLRLNKFDTNIDFLAANLTFSK